VVLLALSPPPKIDGGVLASAVLVSLAEDSIVGHSSHTQHERLLPIPSSRPVTMIKPTRNESPPAITLPLRIERRLAGGRDKNLENGSRILSKMFRKEDLFLKPPGILVTVPGTRAK
jgi:hypothetical protein